MKHFRLIVIAGGAVEVAGILLLVMFGFLRIHGSEVIGLDPGPYSSAHYVIDTEGGGSVEGSYSTESGREVHILMLDERQYEDYIENRSYSTQLSESRSSGEFFLDDPAMERCHVVITHAVAPELPEQLTLTYTVSSMNWNVLALSVALVVGSGGMVMLAAFMRQKERRAVLGPITPYSDVVIFDEEPRKGGP